MNSDLRIRDYVESDYSFLTDMVFGLYADDKTMSEAKIQATIQRALSHPDQVQIKILENNHAIAGYALLTSFWSNEYNGLVVILDELFITPSHRNKSLASQFINQLSKSKTHSTILLEVLKYNTKALDLYKRLGFEVVDRHFMTKKL